MSLPAHSRDKQPPLLITEASSPSMPPQEPEVPQSQQSRRRLLLSAHPSTAFFPPPLTRGKETSRFPTDTDKDIYSAHSFLRGL